MAMLTWLHLSDLHFRAGEGRAWDRDIVLRTLLDDVRERVEKDGLRPDLILVSGDIAFSGQPEEYALAGQFFDKLLAVTGLPKARLFVVPGNHDVDRKAISRGATAIAGALTDRQAVNEVLTHGDDRRLIFRRLDAYARFVNDYFGGRRSFDDEHTFYAEPLDLSGRRVAVLGLNSAWLAAGDTDHGRLALGERQARLALEATRGVDLRIALLHHPFDWLQEFDRDDCEALLMAGCGFVLHGHLHRAGMLSLKTPDAGAMIVAAGTCYENRQWANGYNWIQLDLSANQGTVHLREYSDRGGGFWTKDARTYKNAPDGQFTFPLPSLAVPATSPKPRTPAAGTVAPARLEASYLRRAQTVANALPLAVIDPRAVERTRQQTMDLLPIYVALNTTTQVPVEEAARTSKERRAQEVEPGRETRLLPVLEAAARDRLMVLLGDPGGGKSTFVNYLALCLAGARLAEMPEPSAVPGSDWLAHLAPAWTHGPLLPLQVTLRQFARSKRCDGTAAGLWEFIAETLDGHGLGDFAVILRERLLAGGVLVLLDGLDEVGDPAQRGVVRNAVAEFVATYGAANRYLVTCRGYAYQDACCQLDRFAVHTLAPFAEEQIDAFIGCWYGEMCRLGWKDEADAQELTKRLQKAASRPDLAPLAQNPLQLAMMASLHFSWGRLPDDRVELYAEMVRLLLVRWQEARLGQETGVTQAIDASNLESALEQVAFVAHRSQAGTEGAADIGQALLLSVLKDYVSGSWDRAGALVAYIQDRAGLLMDRGNGTYTFPHRSYQEYLAGSYLAVQPDFPDETADLVAGNYTQWREVALWAVGVMARLKKMTHIAVDVAAALCPREAPDGPVSDSDWRMAYLAGEALLEIGLKDVQGRERHRLVLERVRRWLAALLERGALAPVERAAAGRALARLGDPRPGVGVTADGLPDIAWCDVPAGEFIMGSDESYDEKPPHTLTLPAFRISKYPITNAQFAAFVQDGGYTQKWRRCWTDAGWEWKGERTEPDKQGGAFDLPNHPVVVVRWYEALAFCRWLGDKLGCAVMLPTEAQWEKAASWDVGATVSGRPVSGRSGQKRRYPWGEEITPDHANYDATGIGATTAVGIFPKGKSFCGALDLSGNVWEWTCSSWGKDWQKPSFNYPYRADDGREDLKPGNEVLRVVRGGSYFNDARLVRCAVRYGGSPGSFGWNIGFRVVASPFHS